MKFQNVENVFLMKMHPFCKVLFVHGAMVLIAFCLCGCHAIRISEPPRTATEQLLLSTAMDESLREMDFSSLAGKRVFFDASLFESYDDGYAKGSIREALARQGALLVSDRSLSEVIVEARSGGLGIDSRDSLFGLPKLTIPVPFAGQVESPEIVLYKAQKADSIAKFALLAYETESGRFIDSSGSMVGKSKFHHYKILGFINWRITNIPEQRPGD